MEVLRLVNIDALGLGPDVSGSQDVRHVNTLDGDVPTILLKAPCEGSAVQGGGRRGAVRRLSPVGG
jgi:hypothetical protein